MEKELANIVQRLLEEANERVTVANSILKAYGHKNINNSKFYVHFYDGTTPEHSGRIEEVAELLDCKCDVFEEHGEKLWVGFEKNGVKYLVLRNKEENDGRN